jgi:hypothetical protein
MRPSTNYRYALQPSTFTGAEEQGIGAALANWQAENANTGLATTFQEVGWTDDRELGFVRGPLGAGTGAAIVDPEYRADGYLDRAGILFTNEPAVCILGRFRRVIYMR